MLKETLSVDAIKVGSIIVTISLLNLLNIIFLFITIMRNQEPKRRATPLLNESVRSMEYIDHKMLQNQKEDKKFEEDVIEIELEQNVEIK